MHSFTQSENGLISGDSLRERNECYATLLVQSSCSHVFYIRDRFSSSLETTSRASRNILKNSDKINTKQHEKTYDGHRLVGGNYALKSAKAVNPMNVT